ncbi:phosphodiester glycosidase family protein [Aureibacillus halotolerans]|uniref:Exopolysaccharide biosynthesis protein n=1 Tax=Aureibacillus halotolerans TaxID=1508390 RepID=A0A4R6U9F5_9BACI|nr:phosphodiester glycosidase family protein [Aureibacillus halotolerans]TDQ41459.1 exopolysaccharide biosynthesis protein [Aureibacillus halotolerans]
MGRKLHIWSLFTIAPIAGFLVYLFWQSPEETIAWNQYLTMETETVSAASTSVLNAVEETNTNIGIFEKTLANVNKAIAKEKTYYTQQQEKIASLTTTSQAQMTTSDKVLEQILSNLLGDPISQKSGDRSTIKVYSLQGAGYQGYMAKVSIHSSNALHVSLAHDKVKSSGETTSAAAKRKGATLAVNAGGFWHTGDGDIAPLGITVIDGQIVTMYDDAKKLSVVGFNKQGHLVGGNFTTQAEIKQNNILQAASFTPTLLANGQKLAIPAKWSGQREPRTIIGNFSNGDLLFIVIDGRQAGYSSGVTLEEVQDKLLSFQVKDAFTLDGGGSSSFYYNGKVLNRPSGGQERKVSSHILIYP